jgi:hypothetical protein
MDSSGSGQEAVKNYCEHGDEHLGSMVGGWFIPVAPTWSIGHP